MLKQILIVGFGGAFGSILRYSTTLLTSKYVTNNFPLSTFCSNVIGCFLIGVFFMLFNREGMLSNNLKLLLITGFCGGYTTFSAFAMENIALLQSNNYTTSILYISASIVGGLLSVWAGISLAK